MSDQFFGNTTYSQFGEDLLFANIFWLLKIEFPTYFDIGAHKPFDISNTGLLYLRGGRGVCVEANPNLIDDFKMQRSADVILNLGVGPVPGILPFYMISETSGRNSFDKPIIDDFIKNEYPEGKITEVKNIEVVTLQSLFDKYPTPHLLCLDAEGLDEKIITSTNFNRCRPIIICAEAWPPSSTTITQHLLNFDYKMLCRMGPNAIFIKGEFLPVVRS